MESLRRRHHEQPRLRPRPPRQRYHDNTHDAQRLIDELSRNVGAFARSAPLEARASRTGVQRVYLQSPSAPQPLSPSAPRTGHSTLAEAFAMGLLLEDATPDTERSARLWSVGLTVAASVTRPHAPSPIVASVITPNANASPNRRVTSDQKSSIPEKIAHRP
ncbi:hypothetical protein PMIN01_07852 [Paraphaeosphaeria minitans]|uniref:Uncharacterized protein n=1 Tax=Paraphaeosphaeria minitans TaxID=565426 RepID=A0A9P6KPE4_9PLEO|nr:hypothetical protein PMIN01_07852 [Paraphaeosphaeria minitans]